ncbi:MAG TPA: hypothetical protein VKQ28_14660 [Candidatus Acidoferrum sp.]|nr:hypothetical protein [Candidatus Acidoferrum sp.]
MSARRVIFENGYTNVIDPDRGIGLVVAPARRLTASWRVILLLVRIDEPTTAEFIFDYGRN